MSESNSSRDAQSSANGAAMDSSNEKPHPSEFVEFMTSEISNEKPHPSEYVEFATIHNDVYDPSQPSQNDFAHRKSSAAPPGIQPTQSNDDLFAGLSSTIPGFQDLSNDAKAGAQAEHKMTFMRGVRLYPKAIMWSVLLSCTIIMEGYDVTLINSFFAFPVFRRNYGTRIGPQNSQISAAWQAGLGNGAVAGEIIGLLLNGWLTDKFGYRKTMVGALMWLCTFVFLAFFSFNLEMLEAAEVLCGLSWGIFQTLSTTYAAEVMPVALRAYLTSSVNMCWLIGQIISTGVVRGLVHNQSQWAYRIPFGLQWAFAVPILIAVLMAPESPWWLIRHDRPIDAKKSLLRLTSSGDADFNADETIAMMRHTNEVEKYISEGTSYMDCFKGVDLRRTEIACMVWVTQTLGGSPLTGYAAYFYEQAGFNSEQAFDLSLGMYGLAIVGGCLSWYWMKNIGRRTLYLWGLAVSFIVLMAAGGVGTLKTSTSQSWTLGSLIIFLTFVYDSTLGPICYTLVAEIPSTRLRVKTVVLARISYNLVGLISNTLMPRMLNPTAWNWRGQTCFFWAGTTLLCLLWCYFRLPETYGLTYMEMDILFQKKAKARKFRQFQVNLANTGYFSLAPEPQRGSVWRGYG